jgi:hypothetical protein
MFGTLDLLDGPGSLRAGPYPATLGTTIAPTNTETVAFVLDPQLPDGPWRARITLHSGALERTAEARITFPVHGAAAPVNTREPTSRRLWPYALAVSALLLITLGGALNFYRRRRVSNAASLLPVRHQRRPATSRRLSD